MKRYYILTMALLLAAVTQAQDASADSISIKELSRALEGRVCELIISRNAPQQDLSEAQRQMRDERTSVPRQCQFLISGKVRMFRMFGWGR